MLTLFLACLLTAHAERPIPARDGVYSIGGEFRYFHTSTNFREDGSTHDLFKGASLDNALVEARAAYEYARQWRFFGSLDGSRTDASDGVVSHSNSGVNELGLGAQRWFTVAPFYLAPELRFSYPFWRVNENSDQALIGDGVVQAEAGGWAIWQLGVWQPFAHLAYDYRDAGKSALLKYAAGLHWRPSRLWAQLQYRGYASVTNDSDSGNRLVRDLYVTKVSGGSYRFDPVNPSLGEIALEAGYRIPGGFNAYLGAAQTLIGTSNAVGWTATAGVIYTGRATAANVSREEPADDTEVPFKPQDEKYDESLFKDSTGRRRKRQAPSVDKMLNETEKELEDPDK